MKIWTECMEKLWRSFISEKEQEKAADTEKPSYEQIFCAYSRCFKWWDRAFYVGNHRLCDTFSPARAIAAFALSKENGYPLPIKTCKMISGGYALFISTSGEVLNNNIPSHYVQATAENFAKELLREYKRHLKDVLAGAEP